jgi:ABC-type Fe3+ transport system permease subunit
MRKHADRSKGSPLMPDTEVRSPLERFAIPHQFPPQLSLYGALLAVTAALAQILLGCLIAALWGVRIWIAAASAHSTFWKSFAISGLFGGLAVSLAVLFYIVHLLMDRLAKKA